MISSEGLTKRFGGGHVAVDHVDLDVPAGAVYGFLGPNGSGKTTTIRMLLGLIAPSDGTHSLLGVPMPTGAAAVLPQVGALVEGPAFHPYLSGRDNLMRLDAADRSVPGGRARERVGEALDRVGLSAAARKKYRAYSLGMRQRLGLAGALLRQRELFVLDEPTNGLDPQGTREVRHLVHEVAGEGATVFVSSHLLSEIEQMCTHVGVMSRGKLVFQGSLADLGAASVDPAAGADVRAGRGGHGADRARSGRADGRRRPGLRRARSTGQRQGHRRPGRRRGAGAPAGRRAARPRGAVRRPDRGGLRCRPVSWPGRPRPSRNPTDAAGAAPARRAGRPPDDVRRQRWRRRVLAVHPLRAPADLPAPPQPGPARRAVAARRSCSASPSGSRRPSNGDGPAFIGDITENGLFLAFTSLVVTLPIFLPLTVSVVAGESIAGEASTGSLRNLLVVPVGRTRLLVVKYLGIAAYSIVAAATVFLVGTIVGFLLFPHGPVTLLSGNVISGGSAVWRALLVAGYVAAMLLGIAAIGLFISTLTEVPMGAMAATAVLVIVAEIADAVPQIAWLHPYLFTHYWLAFGDLLRQPIATHDISLGLLSQLAYLAIFGSLAWARFTTKDITS